MRGAGIAAAALAAPLIGHTPQRLVLLAATVGSVAPLTAVAAVLRHPVGLPAADGVVFDPDIWILKVRHFQSRSMPARSALAH